MKNNLTVSSPVLPPDVRQWSIYKIVSPSGRIYIGLSSNIKKRLQYYKNIGVKSQSALFGSLVKYGYEQHKTEVIDTFESDTEFAHGKEMFWIRSFMSNICKYRDCNGLNLTDGGQGTIGYKASDDHKKKLSEIHKKIPISKEHREKMVLANRARLSLLTKKPKWRPSLKGRSKRIISDETRLKMSLAKKGKIAHNKGKPMPKHQLENWIRIHIGKTPANKGKKFVGSLEERKKKFGSHNIGNSYNKGRKQRPEVIAERIKRQTGKPLLKKRKPVLQYSKFGIFIKEYDSIKTAAIETGVCAATIGDISRGSIKNPSKFMFNFKAS